MTTRIALEPRSGTFQRSFTGSSAPENLEESQWSYEVLAQAVRDGGADICPPQEAEALIWLPEGDLATLEQTLDANPQIKWVQLPWAGIESFAKTGLFSRPMTFTSAKSAFAEEVAEHALMLTLACLRQVTVHARRQAWTQLRPVSLHGKRVTVLGGGGIATSLVKYLAVAQCSTTVLRRKAEPFIGATHTRPIEALHEVLPETDVLVVALALTPETHGIIGEKELQLLPDHAVLVNVARGGHIVTEALVHALQNGAIAGAGLDVTDPEPLPDGHPLWSLDNALITSHCADSFEYVTRQRAERIRENVRLFISGKPLHGVVDPTTGY